MSERRYASLDKAANQYDCSIKTLRRMIARGEVTGYRFGPRAIRVDLEELDSKMQPIPAVGDAA